MYILSLGHQIAISYRFGTSVSLDAYWIIFSALLLLYTPLAAFRESFAFEFQRLQNSNETSHLFSSSLNALLLLGIVLGIAAALYYTYGTPLGAGKDATSFPGYDQLVLMMVCGVAFVPINEVMASLLTARGAPAFVQYNKYVGTGVSLVLVLFLGVQLGVVTLALALLVAGMISLCIQLVFLRRQGLVYNIFSLPRVSSISARLAISLFVSIALTQLIIFLMRVALQDFGAHYVSAHQYAAALCSIPESIIQLSFHGVLWTLLSQKKTTQRRDYRRFIHALKTATILMIGIAIVLNLFSDPIVRLLLMRGSFEESSLTAASSILSVMALGLPAQTLSLLYGRYIFLHNKKICIWGWLLQGVFALGVVCFGWHVGSIHLVILCNAISATVAVIFFHVMTMKTQPMRVQKTGKKLLLCGCVAIAMLFLPTPSIQTLPTWLQFIVLSGLCAAYAGTFLFACLGLGFLRKRDLAAVYRFFQE